MNPQWIMPRWPLTDKVYAFTTTRAQGFSRAPYDSFNLAVHVRDQAEDVRRNRACLNQQLGFDAAPKWLKQTHSKIVVRAEQVEIDHTQADASFTTQKRQICAVLTADCLPLLLCDGAGECIAAVHAGWQGLLKGIIEATVAAMSKQTKPQYAWLGPAIGASAFEVGEDVYVPYIQQNPQYRKAFTVKAAGQWYFDIYAAARIALAQADITRVYGGDHCTYREQERFFSFRRNATTGRMATIIMRK